MHFYENVVLGLPTMFFDGFNMFLSILSEKWYRTNMNYLNKPALDPKHAKFTQKLGFWHLVSVS